MTWPSGATWRKVLIRIEVIPTAIYPHFDLNVKPLPCNCKTLNAINYYWYYQYFHLLSVSRPCRAVRDSWGIWTQGVWILSGMWHHSRVKETWLWDLEVPSLFQDSQHVVHGMGSVLHSLITPMRNDYQTRGSGRLYQYARVIHLLMVTLHPSLGNWKKGTVVGNGLLEKAKHCNWKELWAHSLI